MQCYQQITAIHNSKLNLKGSYFYTHCILSYKSAQTVYIKQKLRKRRFVTSRAIFNTPCMILGV